jgi:glycosyltransferase involved in cell wall biosynthesis
VSNRALGPLKTLLLTTAFDRGGAERILVQYATRLPREKYCVSAAALQGRSGAIAAELNREGIPTLDLRMTAKGDFRVIGNLRRLLLRERIQLLVSFMFHSNLLARLVGWQCGVPIRVSTEHIMSWEHLGRRTLNRWTLPLATHVITVSRAVGVYASREFAIPPARLTVIPNGVDTARFHPMIRVAHGCRCIIGCTARLHVKNDHATLLRAFSYLASSRDDVELLLIGRGPEEARLRDMARQLHLANRVRFVGEQPDVTPFLAEMGVYVQPSLTEGLSVSILEAMACGLPVVATAVGGTPEVVVEGETGFLVPSQKPEPLAAALERLLSDHTLAASFGRAGRARVEAHFSEATMLQRVEALLDQLVQRELRLVFDPTRGWVPC